MAKFPFTVKRVLPYILLYVLLLLQARHGNAAPTQHLTVSVEGNTPTLIVTSAQIGITPKIVHATTTTTTATPVSTLSAQKGKEGAGGVGVGGGATKLKGKSYKMQNNKKWQQALREREKSKEKLVNQRAATTTTTSINSEATAAPTKFALKTTPTTRTTTPTVQDSTQAMDMAAAQPNIVMASASTLASSTTVTVNEKPTRIGNEMNAQDVGNTPDAIMSTAAGNMPTTTEMASRVTLESSKIAKTTTSEALIVEESTQVTFADPKAQVALAGDTTLAEKLTTMPTYTELHDTTAATATRHSAPKTTTQTQTTAPSMAQEASASTTTTKLSMVTDAIEMLPFNVMTTTTTTMMTPLKTTAAGTVVTSAFAAKSNFDETHERQAPTANAEYTTSGGDIAVNQNVPTMPITTENDSSSSNTNMKSSADENTDSNLETSHTPANERTSIKVNVTPTTTPTTTNNKDMNEQETSTLISTRTTTTTISAVMTTEATTKSVIRKPITTQKVEVASEATETDSGLIFIDDAADNHEDKQNVEIGELQNDEAITVAGHQTASEVEAHENADGAHAGEVKVIKLIDLEKHDLKSIAKAKKHKMNNNKNDTSHYDDDGDDDGHDGVKRTRKKQLTDKHYLVATEANVSEEKLDTTTRPSTSGKTIAEPTVSVKSATQNFAKENKNQIETQTQLTAAAIARAVKTSTTAEPTLTQKQQPQMKKDKAAVFKSTLKPVHNGYLGPILMEEKRFSVFHANQKPHEHHESTIESQLRHGRLVEILAPTALLEQSTSKTLAAVNKAAATTTTAEPVRGASKAHRAPMLSTTVFQVPESLSSTTHLPLKEKAAQTNADDRSQARQQQQQQMHSIAPQIGVNALSESKISDIQVEVYDSTVDSIVASTNFKDNEGFNTLPLAVEAAEAEAEQHIGTTKPPAATQERFTQYVVDRVDYATQQASPAPLQHVVAGLPEPAAIEIHINVSEGIGNESEDLEFSYRQPDYTGSNSRTTLNEALTKSAKASPLKPHGAEYAARSTQSNIERGDEILVVEIIDTGENSTEAAVSAENSNPIFTFRSDAESDVELKDIKYFPPEVKVKPPQMSDELFLADMKRENALPKPPLPPPPPPRKPTIDRDSDTIFYISNTEVKVGESLPTSNTNFEQQQQQQQQQQLRKTKLENQFFPANYLASTHPNAERADDQPSQRQQHRYEEDIILSPVQNTADSLKIFRSQGADGAPPLDVTYVGESVMEVEQSSGAGAGATTTISAPSLMPDVIIQPAILPEMSIGVPVIGELPPQIELKEIDFMPDEANQQHSGMYENNMLEENGGGNGGGSNGNGNDVDRIVESSVQYGGDLIDESIVGGGFDGVEASYPFGNPMALHNKAHHANDFAHFIVNHGVNNLRKDELSVDVASSGEMTTGLAASAAAASAVATATATMLHNLENGEMKEFLERNTNDTLPLSMLGNGSYPLDEHISNATAKSVMKESHDFMMDQYSMLILILVGLLLFVLVSTAFCSLWILYVKHQITSVRKSAQSQTNENGKNAAENGKSDEKSTIVTTTIIPKSSPSSSIQAHSNGNSIDAMQYTTKPSTDTNNKNVSNGTNGVALINCNAKSIEEVLLLPTDEPLAIPTLNSMSTPLKSSDNNKLQIEVNVNPSNNNSVQDDFTRPNGSVTKMTLKNNHLIVETEERHDISRVARETKMHYNTSEKDGVFVVEVARGIDSKSIPSSPTTEEARPIYESQLSVDAAATLLRTEDEKVLRNHDEIQIHQPPPESIQQQTTNCIDEMPERSLHQIVELDEAAVSPNSFREDAAANDKRTLVRNSNTGLSQSDLSSTSSTGSNKRYSYGNQELYTVEPNGYVTSSPTSNLPLTRQSATDLADDDDRRSENGHSLAHSPAAEGNSANTAVSEEQVVCDKLANNEPSSDQAISENATNASEVVEAYDETAKNDKLEISVDDAQETSTTEVAAQTAVEVKESVENAECADVEEEVELDELNGEAAELQGNAQTEDEEEEIKKVDSEEPAAEVCINNNNNTAEEMDAQLELAVASEAEAQAGSAEDVETVANITNGQSIELTNDTADALHAFPQTITCNYGYDSIISLPDPPSTEEIKQLAAFTILDSSQLDSLPPPSPPPPPTFADLNDNTTTTTTTTTENDEQTTNNTLATEDELTATQLKLQQILHNNSTDVPTNEHATTTLTNGNNHDTTNGNITKTGHIELDVNGHEPTNGHEHDAAEVLTAHMELNTDDNSTGTPLTPPDSPPLSSPLHYNNSAAAISAINGVNRGMCNGPLPVAVNVNGS